MRRLERSRRVAAKASAIASSTLAWRLGSPGERIALPPGVGAGNLVARLGIDRDGADPARAPAQLRPGHDLVALRLQGLGVMHQGGLQAQHAGLVGVRPERAGETLRGEARRLDRGLRVHAVNRVVEKHLQHRLGLDVAARRAEQEGELAVLLGERRIGRQARPLPRCDHAGMARIDPVLVAPRADAEAQARNDRRRRVAVRRRRREAVAPGVGDADIGRVLVPAATPAGGGLAHPGHLRPTEPRLAGLRQVGTGTVRVDCADPRGRVAVREQVVERHVDELRIAEIGLPVGEA